MPKLSLPLTTSATAYKTCTEDDNYTVTSYTNQNRVELWTSFFHNYTQLH